jgi:hypothetical protein
LFIWKKQRQSFEFEISTIVLRLHQEFTAQDTG